MNHRTGERRSWQANTNRTMTQSERSEYRRRIERERRNRVEAETRRYNEEAMRAALVWADGTPADEKHPYLLRKFVRPYGIRQQGEYLLIPICNASGRLQSLQFISPDGAKRFLSGGKLSGGRFLIGSISDDPDGTICIAEGFATAGTVHEETGYPCFVTFACGNLESVAVSIRARYPKKRIVITGDNDHETAARIGQNPGLDAAKRAAAASRGNVVFPPDLPGVSDFNDYARYLKSGGGSHDEN